MKIKIDMKLLAKQIDECDFKAENASSLAERDIFDSIANLLSEIEYALQYDKEIEFEIEEE